MSKMGSVGLRRRRWVGCGETWSGRRLAIESGRCGGGTKVPPSTWCCSAPVGGKDVPALSERQRVEGSPAGQAATPQDIGRFSLCETGLLSFWVLRWNNKIKSTVREYGSGLPADARSRLCRAKAGA
jgi:hypothetical protein